ncbi:MAG: hypothetical protein ACLQME_16315 [Alphaproteobacteria bacterium]
MDLTHSDDVAGEPRLETGALFLDSLPGLLLVVLLLAFFLFFIYPNVLQGELIDTDSYMHVVRLRSVLADGGWHGGFLSRDNAPYGMVLHWSKAFDLIFLALAAPIAALAGWNKAFAVVAPAIGPLSLVALILAAVWATRPLTDATERRLLGMVIAVTPLAVNYGLVGCATYRVEIVALLALFMGLVLRTVMQPQALRHGAAAGLAAAFAFWLTTEAFFVVPIGMLLLGLAWVREGGALSRASLACAAAFALGLALMLAFDPPFGGWLRPELDRLSVVYVAFGALLALLSAALAAAPQRREAWRLRLAVGLAGALVAAACLGAVFPDLLSPERTVYGAGLEVDFWSKIEEGKPAFANLSRGVLFIGGPAIGLVAALLIASRERSVAARAAWGASALALALLIVPGVLHTRFAIYAEVAAALPLAVLLTRLAGLFDRVPRLAFRLLGRALALTLILLGPVLVASAIVAAKGVTASPPPDCAVRRVAAALNDAAFMGGSNLIMMTEPDQAPETLYWTGNRVVAGPYNQNVQGLRDVVDFMTSEDDRAAYAILARRGVAYVMTCNWPVAVRKATRPGTRMLEDRLARGAPPAWLVPQAWPAGIKSDLRLFRVAPAAAPG